MQGQLFVFVDRPSLVRYVRLHGIVDTGAVAAAVAAACSLLRTVVHHDMPKSPEGLVQEAGRAGRDRLPAQVCQRKYRRPFANFESLMILSREANEAG